MEGSSPLSRGIPTNDIKDWSGTRIIPALAGNTVRENPKNGGARDHPRSRGEYTVLNGRVANSQGSSPLSRGIPNPAKQGFHIPRIIPALAGNTTFACIHEPCSKDHPRSRGEYVATKLEKVADLGSSPLSRGILSTSVRTMWIRRIIPALAGNTLLFRPCNSPGWDHPRSRGEYK